MHPRLPRIRPPTNGRNERVIGRGGRVIDLVKPPSEDVQVVHVFDRGADNLEVFCHVLEQQSDWVIRAAQLHRAVEGPAGRRTSLGESLARQPGLGTYELEVHPTHRNPARRAKLELRVAEATIRCLRRPTWSLKQFGFAELVQRGLEVREINVPTVVDPLRWVLWTSLPAETFHDDWKIVDYYEQRWLA